MSKESLVEVHLLKTLFSFSDDDAEAIKESGIKRLCPDVPGTVLLLVKATSPHHLDEVIGASHLCVFF